jgi:hypothetical protein
MTIAAIGRPMTPSSISINGRHSDNLNSGPAKRFLSTPRDEHYPRLMQQHSMADLSMLEVSAIIDAQTLMNFYSTDFSLEYRLQQ